MSNDLLNAALNYASIGWHIFPCRPGLKVPLTSNGVKDATTDAETIKAWWTRWPNANIALACGPKSGVYVVDLDYDEEKGVNGWDTLKGLPDLPDTVNQNSPRGGAHFLYRTDNPPRNKNSFLPGIDIRSEGYYIMLAPSVHPNGKLYAWAKDRGPGDCDLAEFPDFMRPPERSRPVMPWLKSQTTPEPVQPPPAPPTTPVLERARLYLSEIPAAVQGQAGHDKLLWAARALIVGFEMSETEALHLLWNDYNPRCVPPWDRGIAADVKDFERKASEVVSSPGEKPRGWLLTELGLKTPEISAENMEWVNAMLAKGAEATPNVALATPDVAYSAPVLVDEPREDAAPDWLLRPPGLVGDLYEWIVSTAGCPQPMLSLAVAICACGTVMGRKVRDESDGRTNVYMMGVAPSSSGKDHPTDCVEKVLCAAGCANMLGGSRVTSDAAIEYALSMFPIQFFRFDEAGHMLQAIKQAAAASSGSGFLRTIVPCLMSLYSSPHKLYVGKQRAEGECVRINQPHVCIWGMTTPDAFYSGISKDELKDGWLGRCITVISKDRPKYEPKPLSTPPESIVQLFQAWAQRVVPPPEGTGSITGATQVWQITVPAQPAAVQVLNQYRDEFFARMLACEKDGDDTQYLWGKAYQNARRIALILACGDRYDQPEITEYHARYAGEFIKHCVIRFRKEIEGNVAENEWERKKLRILRLLEGAGPAGMSKGELVQRTRSFRDARERQGYIDELVESGEIIYGPHPEKKKAIWLWRKH